MSDKVIFNEPVRRTFEGEIPTTDKRRKQEEKKVKKRSVKRILAAFLAMSMLAVTTVAAYAAEPLGDDAEAEMLSEESSEAYADSEDDFVFESAEETAQEEVIAEDTAYEDTFEETAEYEEEIIPEEIVEVIPEEEFLIEEETPAVLTEEDTDAEEALLTNAAEEAVVTVEEASDEASEESLGADAINTEERGSAVDIELNKSYSCEQPVTEGVKWYYFKFEVKSATPIYLTLTSNDIDVLKFNFFCRDESMDSWIILYGNGNQPKPGYEEGDNAVGWKVNPGMAPWNNHKDTTKFAKGIYYFGVVADGADRAGTYNLMISTKAPKKIKSMKLKKKEAAIFTNATIQMEAVVSPSSAYDRTVTWTSSDDSIAVVDPVTGLVTAKDKEGTATIKATTNSKNSKGKQLVKTCTVYVVDGTFREKAGPMIATKQKVDLTADAYFGSFGKTYDKYTIKNGKKYGKIKKGVFTAKKPGLIEITGYIKAGSQYIEAASVAIPVGTPVIDYPAGAKKLVIKRKYTDITATDMFICEVKDPVTNELIAELAPTSYSIKTSKKDAKSFNFNPDTGKLEVIASGKATVTAVYGAGSNAAKYSYKVAATIPYYTKTEISVMKGQTVTVTIKSVEKGITPVWNDAECDRVNKILGPSPQGYVTYTPDTKNKSKTSHKMKITGVNAGTGALLARIDGVDYVCVVTVTE